MSPSRRSAAQPATWSARASRPSRATPPRSGSPSTLYCSSTGSGPARRPSSQAPGGRAVERVGEADGVDRLHPVRPRDDGPGLVALQAADEVPARAGAGAQRGHLGDLGAGLLGPVLPEQGEPEVEQHGDVGGRHGLGDGHQLHLIGVAPGRGARRRDPLPHGREPPRQLRPPLLRAPLLARTHAPTL